MKNKSIIFSIIFILCFGIFVTVNTKRLVSMETNQESTSGAEASNPETVSQVKSRQANVPPQPQQAQPRPSQQQMAQPQVPQPQTAPQAAPEDANRRIAAEPETSERVTGETSAAPADTVAISPLTGAKTADENQTLSSYSCTDYEKNLQDIDVQIQKMKDSDVEPNTDSYKNMADYEYRLWDSQLNTIYQDILNQMTEEESENLRIEEREWMKTRDLTAHKAISKYSGGTIESLEYIASLADSSRTRAYELLTNYGSYLNSDKKS
ncbi:MAG: lysozyme inhibitor LprI family protein [Clostridium sp.]